MRPLFKNCESCSLENVKNFAEIFARQEPVLIKNLVEKWPAIEKWKTAASFKQRVKQPSVFVPVEVGGNYMSPQMFISNCHFDDLLDYFEETDAPPLYLAQTDIRDIGSLIDDVSPPPQIVLTTGKKTIYKINIWLGGKGGSTSPCHFDPFNNVLCQIFGEKEVLLFPPQSGRPFLYPADGTVQKNTSQVDFDKPDDDKFPLFKSSPGGLRAIIHPGDGLFIPYKWWHWCKATNRSCSVNYWWI